MSRDLYGNVILLKVLIKLVQA